MIDSKEMQFTKMVTLRFIQAPLPPRKNKAIMEISYMVKESKSIDNFNHFYFLQVLYN